MIQFDLLKFDQDNNLILQVSVPDKEYFENVSLTGVYIDTHKSYSSVGPSSNPVYKYEVKDEPEIPDGDTPDNPVDNIPEGPDGDNTDSSDGNVNDGDTPSIDIPIDSFARSIGRNSENKVKHLSLVIPSTDILCDIKGTVFFVWVTATGLPAFDTPCGQDVPQKVQWVINTSQIYEKVIPLLKSMNCDCGNNKDFSNIFLKYKAFQYSMNLGDYIEGINIWNKFFSKEKVITIKKGCGCHGNAI